VNGWIYLNIFGDLNSPHGVYRDSLQWQVKIGINLNSPHVHSKIIEYHVQEMKRKSNRTERCMNGSKRFVKINLQIASARSPPHALWLTCRGKAETVRKPNRIVF
jgi:hypothetical protein